MAHLLRGKQAGVPNDLSAGLGADLFVLDHVCLHRHAAAPLVPARGAAVASHLAGLCY